VREQGIGRVWEIAAGRGRKTSYTAARVGHWIDATLQDQAGWRDALEYAHDGPRSRCQNTIQRAWQDHGLKPHLTKSFKLSRDPKFLEKLTDVVGVYLTPPQNAVALCRRFECIVVLRKRTLFRRTGVQAFAVWLEGGRLAIGILLFTSKRF
jgi:hypothetical protein